MYAGSEMTGPVLDVRNWTHENPKSLNVGIDDPFTNYNHIIWEKVRTDRIRDPEHKWAITLPSGARYSFAWHRIYSDEMAAVDEDGNFFMQKIFELVDCETGGISDILEEQV